LLNAQQQGAIVITVTDSGGAVMPGVAITITGPGQWSCLSDAQGKCTLTGIQPGTYIVRAECNGFQPWGQQVVVGVGQQLAMPVIVEIAALAETVTVTGVTPVIDAQTSARGFEIAGRPSRLNTSQYDDVGHNPFHTVLAAPLSTFSIDVDTASYANTRRF